MTRRTLANVSDCVICGWRRSTGGGSLRCLPALLTRHGYDKDPAAVMKAWERQVDKVVRLLEDEDA